MKLSNLDKVDAWSPSGTLLSPGWHNVEIVVSAEGISSGGHDQLELEMENAEGSIRDWIVVMAKTRGKVKQVLEAAAVDVKEGDWDFDPAVLTGKQVRIKVGEEPDYNDPSKMRLRVQGYTPPKPESDVPGDTTDLPDAEAPADDENLPF